MENRKQKILRALVDEYVQRAEPVASKQLAQREDLAYSSATIRNEMAELEFEGYLEKPHTSAGRIPSDKGYREYVNHLVQPTPLSLEKKKQMEVIVEKEFLNLTDMIKEAAQSLSFATGYTALAISPNYAHSYIKQIKMLLLEPGKALVLLVLSAGLVKDQIVNVPQQLKEEELNLLAQAIEQGLSGKKIDEVTLVTVEACAEDLHMPDVFLNQVLAEAYMAIKQAEHLDSYLLGLPNLLKHPEFSSSSKAKHVLDCLSKEGLLAGYLSENQGRFSENSRYMIRIGQEIALDALKDCSFVTTNIEVGQDMYGSIALIGPKRMAYDEVISGIYYMKHVLENKVQGHISSASQAQLEARESKIF